jgi:cyanocobalamin reductase (cyanide-eliminating) / alkylcobalamin dealkylase
MEAELATEPIPGKDCRCMSAETDTRAATDTSDMDSPDTTDTPDTIDAIVAELAEDLAGQGFDLVAHTTVAAYHAALGDRGDDPAFRLPDFPTPRLDPKTRLPASRCVVLVGNSAAVWPHFMALLSAQPERRREAHPFDRFTAEVLSRVVLMTVGPRFAFDLRFSFEAGARAFSATHLAAAAGLAHRGPAGLAIHPRLGPWFALRAAIVIDTPGRAAPPPDPVCERCREKPCLSALAKALADEDPIAIAHRAVRDKWGAWLAVRDACPVGTAHRYPEAQIRWHYAHERGALDEGSSDEP